MVVCYTAKGQFHHSGAMKGMKRNMKISDIKEYQVLKNYYMEDMQSQAYLLKHKKSGAYLALLSNDDDNKVFNIGFRTPVSDDTGVPHIIEHTVLCGSEKYPAKDPFIELAKGSLNTFLNAMTYPDKTVYPVASCNDKDFQNLMDVYLDAVLNPQIYNHKEIFKQEGWHYELESEDSPLKYNGVVYNEMKGAFSSVDSVLDRQVMHSLFPDTTYGNESGGNPDFIPELTYENYLEFHSKFYHPSNSFIYLYGDMNMEEKLVWLDKEYLCKYEEIKVDSDIELQPAFDKMHVEISSMPISDGESEENNAILSYNMVLGTSLDKYMYQAFQIIDYALMGMPGAPLKQAILDAGIGKDVYSVYENGIYQPFYSFIAKFANETDKDKFKKIIDETLAEIVKNGIDKVTLEAGLNNLEFKYREGDYGRYPKGLIIGLQMFDSWLYDKNEPFIHIEGNETFAFLRKQLKTDYYENLIRDYMIGNNHSSMVILVPKKGLTTENDRLLEEKLQKIKEQMTKEEIQTLIEDTKALRKYQTETSTQEDLEKIPLLSIEDIGKEPRVIKAERKDICGIEAVHHDYFTNGIGYLSLVFKNANVPEELLPYLGLLKAALSYMDTEDYNYVDLSNEINMHTGAIVIDQVIHTKEDEDYISTTEVNVKALYGKFPKAFELLTSIMFKTKFDDYKRLLEIVQELKSKLQAGLMRSGDSAAALRGLSYYSEAHYVKEQYAGISFYKFIEKLEKNFEELKEATAAKLALLTHYIFRPENLIISFTCDGDNYYCINNEIEQLKPLLYRDDINTNLIDTALLNFKPEKKNEGFKTSSQIQYVTRTGSFKKAGFEYNGTLLVVRTIMNYEYLWNNIRVKGGAYGCSASYSKQGDGMFTSYRDPNLSSTMEVYEKAPNFLENFYACERDMTKFIIGTVSSMDMPLTPSDAGARSFGMYITGTTYDELKQTRLQVLETDIEAVRKCASLTEAILAQKNICVIGNEKNIENNKEMFGEVKNLFE